METLVTLRPVHTHMPGIIQLEITMINVAQQQAALQTFLTQTVVMATPDLINSTTVLSVPNQPVSQIR